MKARKKQTVESSYPRQTNPHVLLVRGFGGLTDWHPHMSLFWLAASGGRKGQWGIRILTKVGRDFPGDPVTKTRPSNVGGAGSIPGRGSLRSHRPENPNIRQKQYCDKRKDFFKKWWATFDFFFFFLFVSLHHSGLWDLNYLTRNQTQALDPDSTRVQGIPSFHFLVWRSHIQ